MSRLKEALNETSSGQRYGRSLHCRTVISKNTKFESYRVALVKSSLLTAETRLGSIFLLICALPQARYIKSDEDEWIYMQRFRTELFHVPNSAFYISYTANVLIFMAKWEKRGNCSLFRFFSAHFEKTFLRVQKKRKKRKKGGKRKKRRVSFSFAKQVAWDNRRSSTCDQSTSTTLLATETNDIVQNDRCGRASRGAILPLYILDKTFMNMIIRTRVLLRSMKQLPHVEKISESLNSLFMIVSKLFLRPKSIDRNRVLDLRNTLPIKLLFFHKNCKLVGYTFLGSRSRTDF